MGYWDDARYVGRDERNARGAFDEEAMTLTVEIYDEETDEETELTVPARFEVCGTCGGKGSHVNPSIDDCGISGEDFAEDPDFYEEYRSGRYDVQCYECAGKHVVPVVNEDTCDPELLKQYHKHVDAVLNGAAEQRHERAMGY